MFPLPLNGIEPDGTHATIHRDRFGRWFARIWDGKDKIDILWPGEETITDLLLAISRNYPNTSYTPRKEY